MNANHHALGGVNPFPAKPRRGYWRRFGGKFLLLSIAVHLLLLAAAAYYITEFIVPGRPIMRELSPPANSLQQTADHNQTVTKHQETSAPPIPTRIFSFSRTDLSIPVPPVTSYSESFTPSQIPGTGNSLSPFTGAQITGNAPGNGINPGIGTPNYRPGMLKGTFYDLKFQRNGQPAKDPGKDYADDITHFVMHGWNDSELRSKYLKGNIPLYNSQVFFPVIDTNEGPKAFQSPKPESPGKWIVVFKGDVSPPEGGIYHFVAAGDDDMIIRFNQKTVLFHCEHIPTPQGLEGKAYNYTGERLSYAESLPVNVEAGKTYPIEILIGDDVPNKTFAKVLIEKEGVNYDKDPSGGPILPVFSVGTVSVAPTETPAHLDAPAWHGSNSNFLDDMMPDR